MIHQIIEEAAPDMRLLLVQQGLPDFRVNEVLRMTGQVLLSSIHKRITSGQGADVLAMLSERRSHGTMAFVRNFVHDRFRNSFKSEVIQQFTFELTHSLHLSNTLAGNVAEVTLNYLLPKVIVALTSADIKEEQLRALVGIQPTSI